MKKTNKSKCQVCARWYFTKCVKCDANMCFKSKPNMASISCCLDYHNDDHFGLIRDNHKDLFGEWPSDFTKPSKWKIRANKQVMEAFKQKYCMEYGECVGEKV